MMVIYEGGNYNIIPIPNSLTLSWQSGIFYDDIHVFLLKLGKDILSQCDPYSHIKKQYFTVPCLHFHSVTR